MKPLHFADGSPMRIPEMVRRPAEKPKGCSCSSLSPFLWACHPRPSIFVGATGFQAFGGKTQSQIASASADESLAAYGRSNALPWMGKPGPVANPRSLAVTNNRRKG